MATKKEQGWEMQDRIDTELATDTSSDRNMMDYCDYYHTGKPFITLAGLMKIANEEKFTSEIYDIKNTEKIVDVVVKVTTPEGNSMYSGRTEFHRDRSGSPDKHALSKAINIATKNAVKQLLYGSPKVEKMLNDFVNEVKFIPPTTPEVPTKQEPDKKQEQQPKQEPEKKEAAKPVDPNDKSLTLKQRANAWHESRYVEMEAINKHETDVTTTLQNWVKYFLMVKPADMRDKHYKRVCEELSKDDMGLIGKFFSKPPANMDEVIERHVGEQKPKEESKPEEQPVEEPKEEPKF